MDSTDVGLGVDAEKCKYSKAPAERHSLFAAVCGGILRVAVNGNSCSQTFIGAKLGCCYSEL